MKTFHLIVSQNTTGDRKISQDKERNLKIEQSKSGIDYKRAKRRAS